MNFTLKEVTPLIVIE